MGFSHLEMSYSIINQLEKAGRLNEGVVALEKVIEIDSLNVEAIEILFQIQLKLGNKLAALAAINKLLVIQPESANNWMNKGNLLHELKKDNESLECFKKSIEINNTNSLAFSNQANSYLELGKLQEALTSCETAIRLDDKNRDGWMNKANVLFKMNRLDEAEINARFAVKISPKTPEPFVNLGRILNAKNLDLEAITCYENALMINPNFNQALINLGYTYTRLGKTDIAIKAYESAAKNDSNLSPGALWNMALIYLSLGNWQKGWELYENRWLMDEFKNQIIKLNSKAWNGNDEIKGKRIFIYSEQGFGDIIQFCRFLKILLSKGAVVIFQCPDVLINLLRTLSDKIIIISKKQEIPKHDYNLPLLSLPLKLQIFDAHLFGQGSYLKAINDSIIKINQSNKINIGIAWSGNSLHKNDVHRSIDFEKIKILIEKWKNKASFHSLQKDYKINEFNEISKMGIIDYSNELKELLPI